MAHNIQHQPYPADSNGSEEAKIGFDEKSENARQPDVGSGDSRYNEDPEHHLHRGLKSRQITMIAIGGAIGTGLIIGT